MNISYLLIGGNQGDRFAQLETARTFISTTAGAIRTVSSIYETAPWGKTDQAWFLNQVLQLETEAGAPELLKLLLNIEESMGRKRSEKYGSRIIDIDILFFNDAILREPGLTIPHPEIANRRFVLEPLNEIAPAYIHPVLHRSVSELLAACTDPLEVKKL
ncbi:MAG TPA: 2-amino-4-hydroxy-6-hydroxymethyldihydropteridine diphosphokinase [Puia sp.]|nr:2-amino-4-hydroxy-6-hydroxymethyldihydropteridine diphosphokinase [Puia sp.]